VLFRSVYNGITLSKNIGLDISVSQASGEFTQSFIATLGVQSTPFPHWSVSPFFTLGLGYLKNTPRRNFAFAEERKDNLAFVGAGLRYYITRRLMLIGVVRHNVVFVDRNDNGEFLEWKGGVSIFY